MILQRKDQEILDKQVEIVRFQNLTEKYLERINQVELDLERQKCDLDTSEIISFRPERKIKSLENDLMKSQMNF